MLLAGISASFHVCWDSRSWFAVDGTSWHLKIFCCVRSPWGLTAGWGLQAIGLAWQGPCQPGHVPLVPERKLCRQERAGREGGSSPQPSVFMYSGPWLVCVRNSFLTKTDSLLRVSCMFLWVSSIQDRPLYPKGAAFVRATIFIMIELDSAKRSFLYP